MLLRGALLPHCQSSYLSNGRCPAALLCERSSLCQLLRGTCHCANSTALKAGADSAKRITLWRSRTPQLQLDLNHSHNSARVPTVRKGPPLVPPSSKHEASRMRLASARARWSPCGCWSGLQSVNRSAQPATCCQHQRTTNVLLTMLPCLSRMLQSKVSISTSHRSLPLTTVVVMQTPAILHAIGHLLLHGLLAPHSQAWPGWQIEYACVTQRMDLESACFTQPLLLRVFPAHCSLQVKA